MIPKIRMVLEGAKTKKKMVLAVFDEPKTAEKYVSDLLEILAEGFSVFTEELIIKEEEDNASSN
ncbi:MAG: hypothetical protein PHF05_00410 [Candidatus Izemoplasmatales bacterium]|nr:hypothetical protein [Candidatus Izemoplasmatales bacterium]